MGIILERVSSKQEWRDRASFTRNPESASSIILGAIPAVETVIFLRLIPVVISSANIFNELTVAE